jgi:hypothetical protein
MEWSRSHAGSHAMLSQAKMGLLKELSVKHLTIIDLKTEDRLRAVQDLVGIGYARDFAAHHGHRIPIRLRIWGITSSGRAVLEQLAMAELTKGRQPSLPFAQKKALRLPRKKDLILGFDHQRVGAPPKKEETSNE